MTYFMLNPTLLYMRLYPICNSTLYLPTIHEYMNLYNIVFFLDFARTMQAKPRILSSTLII